MLLFSRETKMVAKILLSIGSVLSFALLLPICAQDSLQDFLNAHNAARAEVGVANLTWSSTVAAYAANYASQRMNDCTLVHSRGPYGENLAWSSGYLSGIEAVNLWVSEKADYDLNSNSCRPGKMCSHYTQVVWQNSQRLGCSKVVCYRGITFICCNYDPPGPEAVKRNSHSLPPLISPNPLPPFISPRQPPNSPNFDSMPNGLVAGLIAGAIAIILGLVCFWFFLRWKRKRNETHPKFDVSFDDEFENGTGPRKFSYRELASATNNFGEEAKLGEGGFGTVYKGFLKDLNTFAAVKKVSKRSKQGSKEYKTEVKIISQLRHKNTVKLIGWCHEKDLILVYEFMPNGSLDSHLFKGKSLLTWDVRYKIVQGLASALLYLHEEGDHCVIHRDIKSSNIMLDLEFTAKLGDFGLARLVDHTKGSQTTALAGTIGYIAPECLNTRKASRESDIFSFGIVVLEIACGRRSIEHRCDEDQFSLVPWVWESYGNKRLLDVVDKQLEMNFDIKQMEYLMIVGLWCAHPARNLRPSIRQAIQALNFELPLPNLPSKMPVPNYDVPASSARAPNAFSGESRLSLTVPR